MSLHRPTPYSSGEALCAGQQEIWGHAAQAEPTQMGESPEQHRVPALSYRLHGTSKEKPPRHRAIFLITVTVFICKTRMCAPPQHNSEHSHAPRGFPISSNATLSVPTVILSSARTPNKLTMNRVSVCPEELPSPLPRPFLHARMLHQHLIPTDTTSLEKPLLSAPAERPLHRAGAGKGDFGAMTSLL